MTREETKRILMVVQAAYPNFSPSDKTVTVDTWHKFLEEYPYEQVDAAIGTYIRSDTSGFAPGIGMVIEKLQTLFRPGNLNEIAAWGMVLMAIRNSGYHAEEEFARLPAVVQKSVGSAGQLREWALADDVDGTWLNVTQSNFMRTYRAEVAREKELRKLSPEIQQLIKAAEPVGCRTAKLSAPVRREPAENRRCPPTPKIQSMLDALRKSWRT